MNEWLLWIGPGLLIGIWMYYDAKARKLENPSVWIWVGLIFGVLGLLTYWYWHIHPKHNTVKKRGRTKS